MNQESSSSSGFGAILTLAIGCANLGCVSHTDVPSDPPLDPPAERGSSALRRPAVSAIPPVTSGPVGGVRRFHIPGGGLGQPLSNGNGEFVSIDVPGAVDTVCNSIRQGSGDFDVLGGYFRFTDGNVYGWRSVTEGFVGYQVFGAPFTSINLATTSPLILIGTFDFTDGSGCLAPGSGPCRSFGYDDESGEYEIPCPPLAEGCNDFVAWNSLSGAFTNDEGVVKGYRDGRVIHPPGATYSHGMGFGTHSLDLPFYGRFVDEDGMTHGFVYRSGTYTTVDVPAAAETILHGGSLNGQIAAGEFTDEDGATHGFLLAKMQKFTTIDFPGASATVVRSVETPVSRNVCGSYTDEDGRTHGFVYRLPP